MKTLSTLVVAGAALMASGVAMADLTVVNNSDAYSAVKIDASGVCTAEKGLVTAPGDKGQFPSTIVNLPCGGQNPCEVDLYMLKKGETTCNPDEKAAHASYNTQTGATVVSENSGLFDFDTSVNNQITITNH